MSQTQIDQLKSYLESELGLIEGNDYELQGNGENSAMISVSIPLDEIELPEALKSHAPSFDEVFEALEEGRQDKNTRNGVSFELALRSYAYAELARIPEHGELERSLAGMDSMKEFRAYEARIQELWSELWERPDILALKKDLEENYL